MWSDQPTPADYDGDGITDLSIWRPTDGSWYTIKSSDSTYQIQTLGNSGDTAVPSAYTKQVGGTASGDVIAAERVKPRNATGDTNLYSQNFGWGTSLAGLPGRAGLDAGFGIGYNSLVWLKVGNAMYFDPDHGNMTPGFRIGAPSIEPIYYNATRSKWAYMMVTPSGSRVEFIETAASNVYETADSSYTQLVVTGASNPFDPVENLSIKVTSTDGTQMTYAWAVNSYKCTQIKDRNGNYITLAYDSLARLATMTDTLGRVVTVNYGNNDLPSTITQTWKDNNGSGSNVTHTWATFAYTTKTVDTDFATSLSVVGPPDGTVFTVLDKITYPDSSSTKFEYNDYLQVKKISSIAADSTSHVLNYVTTNLATPSSAQTDCPRFTETRSWVENVNQNSSGTAQEVVVTNSLTTGATYNLPGSITGSATRIDVAVTGHPDNLITRQYVGASGYKDGLALASEDCVSTNCTGTDRKRWTWTDWTQDDTSKSYITNPRVIESRVGDGTNTKRSTVEYYPVSTGSPVALYGLVKNAFVYDTDLTTVLKQTYAEYNLDTTYTSRRIIGLPSLVEARGRETSGLNLMSKVTFAYDESGYTGTGQSLTSATKHDTTNYGTSFSYRGNQTSTRRWDVTYPTTESASVLSSVKYNIAGSPISQTTPWDGTNTRTVSIGYADSWNDGATRTTYAYPTTLTDPASNSSTVKYRFDIGANVEATSPAPAGQTYGKTSKRIFDSVGRLERNSVYVNTTEKSYIRYEFPTNGIQSQSYSPIVDVDGDGNIAEDEVYSESWHDGAGRVRKARTEHPGSTGGWTATQTEYDILGRVYRASVPTEISVSGTTWTAAGDDATRGWIWNYAYYDWKGRTVRTVPSDSTGSDGKDTLITYEGCGCAGGQVTTVKGPVTTAVDVSGTTQTTKRRTQKVYEDILGRTFKAEVWDLDGGGSAPYSTTKTTFNGRDQATLIREYSGSDSSTTYQDSTMSYDGHGRVYQSHKPEQRDTSNNPKYTTYSYNLDDSISNITDGRGAVTNYTYNSRSLVTNIGWTVPSGSGITDPTDVTFSYDNLGNRTQMTDGLGTQTYAYDSLSQMTSETRDFSDSLSDSPGGQGVYELEYAYHIGGQLKSYKDPWDKEIAYSNDKTGRLNSVTGTPFADVTTYLSNPQYRAWGAVKHLEYGNGNQLNATHNNRLQTDTLLINNIRTPSIKVFDKTYEYYSDGMLKLANENSSSANDKFDRLFKYDHVGRTKEAKSGIEAQGQTETDLTKLPYRQSYTYNALGNLTGRDSTLWNYAGSWNFSYSVANNRVTNQGYQYDFDGRQTYGDGIYFEFDAIGNMTKTDRGAAYETLIVGDGFGRETKRSQRLWNTETTNWDEWDSKYFIYSTVIGRVVSEATKTGKKWRTFVIANGSVIARQAVNESGSTQLVTYEFRDASGLSATSGGSGESPTPEFEHFYLREELDGRGNSVGHEAETSPLDRLRNSGSPADQLAFDRVNMGHCMVDGIFGPCDIVENFQSLEEPTLGGLISVFSHGNMLPVQLSGRMQRNRNNPMYIAREILKTNGMLNNPISFFLSPFQSQGQSIESPSRLFNSSDREFNQLLGGPSQSGDKIRLTKEEVEAIRKRVQGEVSSNDTCAQFIEKLASITLGKEVNASELLNEGIDRVNNTLGFYWAVYPGAGGVATAHKIGSPHEKLGEIWYSSKKDSMAPVNVAGLIHEIMHVAARASDIDLSRAIQKLGLQVFTERGTVMEYPNDTDNSKLAYSSYWGQALKNHCGPGTRKIPWRVVPK